MHVVTFYSFKGGVGRTMALVNVASELARRGRKVLVVDFDLEAPGLDTFDDFNRPSDSQRGVVDYVTDYLESSESPDVSDYLYRAQAAGQLWIMPSGRRDPGYGLRLNSIGWADLYAHRHGYLFFEDLKVQWERTIAPDYVLVDSRTGHTDVGGICTRQLPNAVAVLFFPNEQNLQGLQKIVTDIRRENSGDRQIDLHFVTSNVPDLDDEDQILQSRLEEFQRVLGYDRLDAIIHHYDSLSLLNQMIFTTNRPRSRLAGEYLELLEQIVRGNLRDREGALSFLRGELRQLFTQDDDVDDGRSLGESLEEILTYHGRDGEVLALVADLYQRTGQIDNALETINTALSIGYKSASLYDLRARINGFRDLKTDAISDLTTVILAEDADSALLQAAIYVLRDMDPGALGSVLESPAFGRLEVKTRCHLIQSLLWEGTLEIARQLLDRELRLNAFAADSNAGNPVALALICFGRYGEAIRVLNGFDSRTQEMPSTLFNHAMASWALTGTVDISRFKRVSAMDIDSKNKQLDRNTLQCVSISFWVIGEKLKAIELARRAMHVTNTSATFSAWRYMTVSSEIFRDDIIEMLKLFETDESAIRPEFFARNAPR